MTRFDPRLPFPDSVGEIFPGPATTQKVYQGRLNGFQINNLPLGLRQ